MEKRKAIIKNEWWDVCVWQKTELTSHILVKMFETSLELYLLLKGDSFFVNIENEKFEKKICLFQRGAQKWVERSQIISLVFFFNLIFRMDWDYNHGIGNFSSHMSPEFSSWMETICDHRGKCSCWQMGISCCVGSKLFNDSHGKPKFPWVFALA